jgi:hypothetical protein
MAMVGAHLKMIGRLSAEESIAAVGVGSIGRATKRGEWQRRQLSAWRRAASEQRATQARPGDLRAMRIGVRVVKRGK